MNFLRLVAVPLALVFSSTFAAAATGHAQSDGPFHPLDALTPDEIDQTVKLLKAAGDADANTVYPALTLQPASKDAVRAWKPGTPYTRSAFVVLRKGFVTYEAVVDLTNKKVDSFTPRPNAQPMIMEHEWAKARDNFMGDQRFKDAIAARKLDAKNVYCTPNSAGSFPGDGYEGKRILKIPCFVKEANAPSGRPVEGLMGIVDADSGAVLSVVEGPAVDLPPLPALPKPEAPLKPVAITTPEGSNIKLSGNLEIAWENWTMHARADKRAGLILNLIRFKDGERVRDVAYQINLSEVFVPYMDPSPEWNYRTFLDAGEFGLGYMISPMHAGVDCPEASYLLDLSFPNDIGGTYIRPNALCIFERATGDPAWRHYSADSKTISGVPQTELVVRHIPTLGNYDYVVDYVFSPQGNINMRVGVTGFDAVKSTSARDLGDPAASEATRYGSLIAPYQVAPNLDHYFNFRIDLDVDGPKNALVRDTILPSAIPGSTTRRSLWTLKSDRYATEGPIAEDHNAAGESWRVINPNETTSLKANPGYWIQLNHGATSVLDKADPPQLRAGFSSYELWASHYAEGEDWAAGLYPNLSIKDEGLPAYVSQKRSINNEDLVIWYTMGFRYTPRPEDYPFLPTFWHEMTLRPAFFFDRDPSYTFNPGSLPLTANTEKKQ